MESFLYFLKFIAIIIIAMFSLVGVAFITSINDIPTKVHYYENTVKLDAIEYHNEIYLKKGE